MNGFNRLREMLDEWLKKNKDDEAFKQTVNYLLDRPDLEPKYLNEEKTLDGLHDFIHEKGKRHLLKGWCYITNEVVYSWAVMYFSLPNSFLKIKSTPTKSTPNKTTNAPDKDNVIPIEKAKEKVKQLSLFGGVINE